MRGPGVSSRSGSSILQRHGCPSALRQPSHDLSAEVGPPAPWAECSPPGGRSAHGCAGSGATRELAHVALLPGASRLRSPLDRSRPLLAGDACDSVLQWRAWQTSHSELWRVSLVDALAHAAWCIGGDHFAAIVEKARFLGLLGGADLAALAQRSPRARRQMFDRLDPRAESGAEPLVRLALTRAGLSAVPQVRIPGVGRVDLLVGSRVIVEVDSVAWHDDDASRARDYRRDLMLFWLGYVVVRASWFQAMFRRHEVRRPPRAGRAAS